MTIPHDVTYRNLNDNRPQDNTSAAEAFNLCGCGWPENMLIPKGTTDGYQCQLFVMVSNGADDQVCVERITSSLVCVQYSQNIVATRIVYIALIYGQDVRKNHEINYKKFAIIQKEWG